MHKLTLTNYGAEKFQGWLRTTSDFWQEGDFTSPLALGDMLIVPGREIGFGVRTVDVLCTLNPGETKVIPMEDCKPLDSLDFLDTPLQEIKAPSIDDVRMKLVSCIRDGAHTLYHWNLAADSSLTLYAPQCDVWAWSVVGEPHLLQGEVLVTYSNPSSQANTYLNHVDFKLEFEGGITAFDRLKFAPIIKAGETFADGQARALPFSTLFPANLLGQSAQVYQTANLKINKVVGAHGLKDIWPLGSGRSNIKGDKLAWINNKIPATLKSLFDWSNPGVGPASRSTNTGAQEDQFFVGGEIDDTPLGNLPRYYAALGQFKRPCHHLEKDGNPLNIDGHPDLVMWNARPHYDTRVSKDQLGKTTSLKESQANGWWGPDEEHFLINTLFVAARTTGSPALQRQLEQNAINWYFQKTLNPALATTRPGAARAVGYEGWAAFLFWHGLENRELANRVIERAKDRVRLVLLPKLKAKVAIDGVWDARKDVPSLGSGRWWMCWQQGVGAYGLYRIAELVGDNEAMEFAVESAKVVIEKAYHKPEGSEGWMAYYSMCLDDNRVTASNYADFGCPLALAICPDEEKIKSLLEFGLGKWTCPTLLQRDS